MERVDVRACAVLAFSLLLAGQLMSGASGQGRFGQGGGNSGNAGGNSGNGGRMSRGPPFHSSSDVTQQLRATPSLTPTYEQHVQQTGKKFSNEKRQNYAVNHARIATNNARFLRGEQSFYMRVNKDADLSDFDYETKRLGFKKQGRKLSRGFNDLEATSGIPFPDERSLSVSPAGGKGHWPPGFDFRKKNNNNGRGNSGNACRGNRCKRQLGGQIEYYWDTTCLPPTRDQGLCGCCYAVTTMSTLETQRCLASNQFTPLSFQHAIDCNPFTYGCEGGWPYDVYWWLYYTNATINEADYGYQGIREQCQQESKPSGATRMKTPYSFYYSGTNCEEGTRLIEQLLQYGPVVAGVNAVRSVWNFYGGGVINTCDGGSNTGGTPRSTGLTGGGDLNHAVIIVGDGTTDDGVEFWVLLNSWGLDWGAGGYALVKKMECNICQAIFQPILLQ